MANDAGKKGNTSKAAKSAATKNKAAIAPVTRSVNGLPDAETLKGKFKEGSVPLQGDFASLIDIANFGRLAVGNDKPGWGLALDSNGKLNWDINRIFNVKWSLSPTGNEEKRVFDPYLPDVAGKHGNIALLTLQEEVGPIEAVNSYGDPFTVYNLKTAKITADGKRSNINLKVRAYKYIGTSPSTYYPMEYLPDQDLNYSLFCHFYLDTSTENFEDCMLEIEPLTLAVHYIPDFNSDPVGEIVSLITIHFTYSDPRQLMPKGMITMFSGSKIPDGWALCDGENGTPDLIDKFVLGGKLENTGTNNAKSVNKSGKNYQVLQQTENSTVKVDVTVNPHILTEAEMPRHSHYQGEVYDIDYDFQNGSWEVEGEGMWINGGGTGETHHRISPYTFPTGGTQPHSHSASVETVNTSHNHEVDIMPPYYVLAFIMKL